MDGVFYKLIPLLPLLAFLVVGLGGHWIKSRAHLVAVPAVLGSLLLSLLALFETAGGKNIAPQPIENMVKTNKFVSQAVMIGDRRKFPVLLVVPNFEQLEKWAKLKNMIWTDRSQLLAMPAVNQMMDREVRSKLTGLAPFEMPKKIALLGADFSVDSGELTPTLKVKRRVIEKNYKSVIDSLYTATDPALVSVRD